MKTINTIKENIIDYLNNELINYNEKDIDKLINNIKLSIRKDFFKNIHTLKIKSININKFKIYNNIKLKDDVLVYTNDEGIKSYIFIYELRLSDIIEINNKPFIYNKDISLIQ